MKWVIALLGGFSGINCAAQQIENEMNLLAKALKAWFYLGALLAVALTPAAYANGDMPGGPKVNQLDFPTPAKTGITAINK